MNPNNITTAFSIDGMKVVKSLGVVRGVVVRSRSIFGTIGGSLQTIFGGDITLFTELCEKTRFDAMQRMVEHARQLGANGIIGMRYESNEVLSGVTEVLAYGTAVVMEKES
ncbi:MAG: YbjQ family protein [Ignavibacteriaceae bacterium]|nr:YbjQ family protein [Ignavibacteriaceae bacterium]